ncbi:hypothetical protein BH24CHL9_BH24CHL9_14920 [soil metagenome]
MGTLVVPADAGDPGQEFEDLEGTVTEVRAAMTEGLRTIVEMTPVGCGRDPAKMRKLSEATGLHVIAAAGFHRDAQYPTGHWIHEADEELLTKRVLDDLTLGMHPHDWLDPFAAPGCCEGRCHQGRVPRTIACQWPSSSKREIRTGRVSS